MGNENGLHLPFAAAAVAQQTTTVFLHTSFQLLVAGHRVAAGDGDEATTQTCFLSAFYSFVR